MRANPPPSPLQGSCAARVLSANLETCSSGFGISMAGNWCQAQTMRSCVKPLSKSLVRDPRHRSDSAQASARSCKGNRTEGMANSSNPANDLSSCEDEGPKWTIPRGLKPRRLICLLPESHPNSARQAARHQFTQAFLLITGSLPAKYMITKEVSSAHILGPGVRARWCAGAHGSFSSHIHEALARTKC